MLKWILFTLFTLNSFALEISIDSAKDDFTKYSVLTLKNPTSFTCQTIKNDFNVVTKVICAFSKKPSQNLKYLQNDFFKVNTTRKKDIFFLIIQPVHKIKLIADIFDLTKDDTFFSVNARVSKRWTILGYKSKVPLLKEEKKTSEIAIDFPFFLDKSKLPYVGSLDLKGNPVHIKKVEDVKDYLKVKKFYKEKRYDFCLESIEDILKYYPNTLFKDELLYYKIKVFDKLKEWENVLSSAKTFLREYSSSDNVAEVLSLLARAYTKMSLNTDADYFFDRLFSEHSESVYAQWGYIYKGEMLEESGGTSEAIKYYQKALQQTNDLEVAATAAFKLVNLYLGKSTKKAAQYAMKIVKAKPDFFMEDLPVSKKMMESFADAGYYEVASAIADAILMHIDATYDEYEELLKNKAIWLAKTDKKEEALAALNEYMKKFPDGDYIDVVQTTKDELFFDIEDLNVSEKMQELDKLIQEYGDDTIGERALYEKAKLLLANKKYTQVLEMQNQLERLDEGIYPEVENIVHNAAIGMMKLALQEKNCAQVLVISNEHNITLSDSWDDGIYSCAMQGGDFQLSKKIAMKNVKSKDIQERMKWLYRYIKVDFATGNYTELVDASKDLIALIDNPKTSPYKEVYRILFDTYKRVEKKDKMLKVMMKIEEIFGLDYKDIDRYVAMITLADEMHDDNMLIKYANKVLQIQKESNSYAQSPFVEFALYGAYMNKKEYNKALDVISSLNKIKLNPEQRARQKYLLGTVLAKLWRDDEAKVAYQSAIQADKNSPWAKLATTALNY
ncbi:flagellar protein [Sulfurimonas sp.]|uniref:tetratricopeptide repeat protein n=1 Tax=Sulfurimonas sp. TaxID=2022749 RepID=UPI0026321E65|nr:flagellar protein [Sulfurimonas sp.]